jgi:hypothetical protein
VADSWLHEVVRKQGPQLWPTVGHTKLCVDGDLNFGQELVTRSCG